MILQRTFLSFSLVMCWGDWSCAAEVIDYENQIRPIFAAHCVKCHGEAKAQAKLRLDTAQGIEAKVAADPELLVAGRPDESELYQRLVLPADSKKRMPKGGDPLSEADVQLIAQWIKQGAVLKVAAAATTPSATTSTPVEKKSKKLDLPEVAVAPQAAIEKLVAAGARVSPLFAGSNLLDVSFAGRGEPAGDAEAGLLAAVADQVYALNLSNANLTAGGMTDLAKLKNLSRLHLEHAEIDDAGLAELKGLQRLEYLNVYGTTIGDTGIAPLAGLPHLSRLYLWQTKVSYDAAMALEQAIPGLEVNLGYDHPVVARKRLTQDLESAKKQMESAKADITKLESQLNRAKKDVESSTTRVGEIENELSALDKPANGT